MRLALPLLLTVLMLFHVQTSPMTGVRNDAPGAVVPASYFGMTIFNSTVPAVLPHSTVRSWDTWPHPSWSDENPSKGVYNFTALDQFIAGNQGRDMIYTLGRTPQWASSKPNARTDYGPGQCAPPTNMGDWDDYVRMAASRAAGRIKYWEIWNEPQNLKYYCGDIPTMVVLAQHARRIIKSIDPSAVILSPSPTSGNGPKWLSSFLSQGGAATVDVIAFHGYASGTVAEEVKPVVEKYKAVAAENGLAQMEMWDTENSNKPTDAAFLSKVYLLERSIGVSRVLWFAYDNGGQLWNPTTGLSGAGVGYREIYKWMVGAALTSPCSEDSSGVWTCVFTRAGYRGEVLWNSTLAGPVAVPSQYKDYRDLEGGQHPIVHGKVSIGNEPILIETKPLQDPS